MQRGNIFRRGRYWLGRWREDVMVEGVADCRCTPVNPTRHIERRQHAEKLAPVCDRYRVASDVETILQEKLKPLNDGKQTVESTMSVAKFGDEVFLPHADKETRPSTAHGYRSNWLRYLRPRLQKITVRDFRCVDATRLLADIHRAHDLNMTTMKHLKALLSGIFTYAKQLGAIDGVNPVTDAGISRKVRAPKPTHAYSVQEISDMLAALDGTAKLAVALMFFTGLRPSEASGLQWTDYDAKTKTIRVTRSRWRGADGETKTASSKAPIPVPQWLADLLDAAPQVSEYVLTSATGLPADLHNLAARTIRPALAKCSVCRKEKHAANGHEYKPAGVWHGFYAGRRGCATLATSLETPLAAKGILRHGNIATTEAHYIKSVPEDTLRAVAKIDALFAAQTVTQ